MVSSETRLPARINARRNAIDHNDNEEINNDNPRENKENIPEILGNILGEQISS